LSLKKIDCSQTKRVELKEMMKPVVTKQKARLIDVYKKLSKPAGLIDEINLIQHIKRKSCLKCIYI